MATIKQMLDVAGTIENAEKLARKMIQENPNYYMDLYLILSTQGKFKEAETVLNQVVEEPIRSFYNRGYLEMMKGDLLSGFVMMNYGRHERLWNCPFQPNDALKLWRGNHQNLKDKHLLFICEAGFGDQIIFVRFVKQFIQKGALVTIACARELMDVFDEISDVHRIVPLEKDIIESINYDYWTPAMYAPVSLQINFNNLESKPYLKAKQQYIDKFKKIINKSNKLKIGIRWLGQEGDDYITRVFPEQLMFDAVNQSQFELYSLQKDINNRSSKAPEFIVDLESHLKTWNDTMGAIANLDLVITSCTSIAHISAAMGKETWVIVPVLPYYIWCFSKDKERKTSPWYDNIKLFRQSKFGVWSDVFDNIKTSLNVLF